jgi:predicted transcriptional regulator
VKTMTIGIMSQGRIRARALAIARGKYKPKPGEPKIWFPSMRSVAEVLSDENRALLHVIRESQPNSLGKLAQLTGRQVSNLSRTLKTMSHYGLVELKRSSEGREIRPIVKAREFMILAPA